MTYFSFTHYVLMCPYCVRKMRLKLTYCYTFLAGVIFHIVVKSTTILNWQWFSNSGSHNSPNTPTSWHATITPGPFSTSSWRGSLWSKCSHLYCACWIHKYNNPAGTRIKIIISYAIIFIINLECLGVAMWLASSPTHTSGGESYNVNWRGYSTHKQSFHLFKQKC